MTPIRRRTLLAATGAAVALPLRAQAAWPTQPVRFIVPFPPAGGTDLVSRLLCDKLTAGEGWNFVVENRAGAGGNIGMEAIAHARPDGYTIGMGQTSDLAINPALYRKLPFDPLRDFVPVALVASQPLVLVVRADAPHAKLADLVQAMKARPGALSMASAGAGTVGHLSGELFARRAGVKFLHVPYKGAGPAATDLLGGQVDFYFATPQAAVPLVQAQRLRALAVTSLRRLPVLPDVPTIDESGYKGFEATDWKGLVAPAGTPAAIVQRLNAAVDRALGRADTIARLLAEGSVPLGGSSAHFAQVLKAETARWGQAVRQAGVTLD